VSATAIPVVNAGKRDIAMAIMRGVMRSFVFFTPVSSLCGIRFLRNYRK
jgi:hypothetical protein